MRPLLLFGLLVALVALAGCGSPSPTPSPTPSPHKRTQEELKEHADNFDTEPKKGDRTKPSTVPNKFVDIHGKPVDLASYHGKSNVVLVVVKGLPEKDARFRGQFCPGCLAQLNSLTANYAEFQKRNAEIVMIFPGPDKELPRFLSEGLVADGNPTVPFRLVPDSDLKAVKSLGIEGDWARPSTYILDKGGSVVFAYVGPDGTTYDRPSVKVLLGELNKLN